MSRESLIFSELEYKEFQLRKQGKKKHYSIFTNRLKPKLLEILELFKDKKIIEKIIVPKSNEVKRTRRASPHR